MIQTTQRTFKALENVEHNKKIVNRFIANAYIIFGTRPNLYN